MVKILDAKYEKADLPAIIRENCSHLTAAEREKLLSVLIWQALPYPAQTQSCINEGNQTAVEHWSVGVATIIKMGIADIYYTQKG